MTHAAVAVVMTVYNERADWLDRAVSSVLRQSFGDLELIIVDDGSTAPGTRAALARAAGRDRRVRLERIANGGPAAAANHGIARSRAPLIIRHDSDDWSEPERIARQAAVMADHPDMVMVGSAVRHCRADGEPLDICLFPAEPAAIRRSLPRCNPMAHGALCLRRSAVEAVGGYRTCLRFAEDYDLVWRLGEIGDAANLPEVLYNRTLHAGSLTAMRYRDRQLYRDAVRLLGQSRRDGAEMPPAEALALAAARGCSEAVALAGLGDSLMRAGEARPALAAYLASLRQPGRPTDRLRSVVKLGRLAAYVAVPALRHRLFHEPARTLLPASRIPLDASPSCR